MGGICPMAGPVNCGLENKDESSFTSKRRFPYSMPISSLHCMVGTPEKAGSVEIWTSSRLWRRCGPINFWQTMAGSRVRLLLQSCPSVCPRKQSEEPVGSCCWRLHLALTEMLATIGGFLVVRGAVIYDCTLAEKSEGSGR